MQELLALVIEGPCEFGNLFRIKAVGDLHGESKLERGLLGLVRRICGACHHVYGFLCEVLEEGLEVSQLLIAEGSPVSPVEEENSVTFLQVIWQREFPPVNESKINPGKRIPGVQLPIPFSCHFSLSRMVFPIDSVADKTLMGEECKDSAGSKSREIYLEHKLLTLVLVSFM